MFAKRFFYVCAGIFLLALSYHLGARSAGAQASWNPTEMAVLTGIVDNGGTIPLPTYADGTPATEAECKWTVSPCLVWGLGGAARIECRVDEHRVVGLGTDSGSGPSPNQANYIIVATRFSGPVSAQRETFGAVKSRYRGAPGVAQPAPQDR